MRQSAQVVQRNFTKDKSDEKHFVRTCCWLESLQCSLMCRSICAYYATVEQQVCQFFKSMCS